MVLNRHGRVIAINTFDFHGRPIHSESYFGRDFSQAAWFRRAVGLCTGGESAASASASARDCVAAEDLRDDEELDRDFANTGKVLTLAAPIRMARTGEVGGVWVSRIAWDHSYAPVLAEEAGLLRGGWLAEVSLTLRNAQGQTLYRWTGAAGDRSPAAATDASADPRMHGAMMEAASPSHTEVGADGLEWSLSVSTPRADASWGFNLGAAALAVLLVALGATAGWLSLGGTIRAFHTAMEHLDDQSEHLRNASGQLTGASQELAQSATEQASSLQQTASAIDEINSMINRSAENAERSIRIAESSQETASRGKQVVDTMIRAISEISESNGSILKQIEAGNLQLTEIIKVISEIGNKTKVINDIAFQTKLLSFNASVEAARAGEHGKGFAVVAEEVGSLAQMSGNAAKDIGDMLTGSISTVQGIVDSSRTRVEKLVADGKAKIDMGIQVARQCEKVLEEIVRAESQMNSIINEIANASRDQAQGMGEITRAVGQLDQVTNRNANIAQQTEEFSHAISGLASNLKNEVSSFRLFLDGQMQLLAAAATPTRSEEPADTVAESPAPPVTKPAADNWPHNVIPLRPQSGGGETSSPLDAFLSDTVGRPSSGSPAGVTDATPSESDPRFKEV
jgi:methyl-accepting chemotaxis protein